MYYLTLPTLKKSVLRFSSLSFITTSLIFCSSLSASEYDVDYFGLSFENDVFYDEDGGYSNGVLFNWGYYDVDALDDKSLPAWIAYLTDKTYLTTPKDRQYSVRYSIGHLVQTSTEIKTSELMEEDAPYVGMFAWEVNAIAFDEHVSDDLSLTLGIVGPAAGGEQVQSTIHGLIGANDPKGWDHQINNEFVFRLQAKRLWRSFVVPLGSTEMDVITGVNAGFGNLLSDANAGVGIRWGQQLQSSFSSSSPFVVQKFNGLDSTPNGWFLFANISGSYVLNDIFINGNTFSDSHSVDLIHWQAGASVGAQLNLYNWNFIYSMIYTTDQYTTQSEDTRLGTITITYNF